MCSEREVHGPREREDLHGSLERGKFLPYLAVPEWGERELSNLCMVFGRGVGLVWVTVVVCVHMRCSGVRLCP